MRDPIANTTHYANGPTLLDKQFNEIFEGPKGPGTMPVRIDKLNVPEAKNPIKALIVPHAPYSLPGACASWAYKALSEEGLDTTTYFIVAQAQKSSQSGTTAETFQMPYGEVRVDQDIVRELVKKGNIGINEELHRNESLIEIQIPYLQVINKNKMEKVKIVPLLINEEINCKELSVDIKEILMEQNKKAVFIFVTNLTSYGRNFHFVPFTEEIPENIAKIDKLLIDAIKKHDEDEFFEAIRESMAPLSGYYAMKLFFHLIKAVKTTLEQNYLSGDMNGDYKHCVSYASFVVR